MIRSLGLPGLGGRGFGAGKVQHKVSEISLNQFCKIIPASGGGADLFFELGFRFLFCLGLGAGVWDGCSHMSRVTISRRGKEQRPNMIRSLGLAGLGGGGFGAGKVQHKVSEISLKSVL